jgi:hypothetical protein
VGRHAPANDGNGYSPDEPRPLRGYAALLTTFSTAAGASGLAIRHRGVAPERVAMGDLLLLGVATHKLSRLITRDAVLSPLRAPFTRYLGPAGDGEVREEPRGHGSRHAIGELMTCPFCLGAWIATGLTVGLALAPGATRLVTTAATALAISDALQFAYAALERTDD